MILSLYTIRPIRLISHIRSFCFVFVKRQKGMDSEYSGGGKVAASVPPDFFDLVKNNLAKFLEKSESRPRRLREPVKSYDEIFSDALIT